MRHCECLRDVISYGRQNVVALGKFALNLTRFPRDHGCHLVGHLSRLLSTLLTKVLLLLLVLRLLLLLADASEQNNTGPLGRRTSNKVNVLVSINKGNGVLQCLTVRV